MRVAPLARICIAALSLACVTTVISYAQAPISANVSPSPATGADNQPLCNPESIDSTFTYADKPVGEQTVSLHLRNTGTVACLLRGEARTSFAVDGHVMLASDCWLCDAKDQPSKAPKTDSANQIVLAPGDRATLDVFWSTAGTSCQWADWFDISVEWTISARYLFIPSNWPMHICSAVKSSGYHAALDELVPKVPALKISVLPETLYSDEPATLHVELTNPSRAAEDPSSCVSLYTVSTVHLSSRRGPMLDTRFDPAQMQHSHYVPSFTPEQIQEDEERSWPSWKKKGRRECYVDAGTTKADAKIGAWELANLTHVEWVTTSTPGGQPVFVTAATHLAPLDVNTLPPNWGEPVEGIRAGLSVDRTNFSASELIPLHLRWENLSATKPLAQSHECGGATPSLEALDEQYNVLRTVSMDLVCDFHGSKPFAMKQNEPMLAYRTLDVSTFPWSPPAVPHWPGPGTYYLVTVWTPRALEPGDSENPFAGVSEPNRIIPAYATARSLPVRITITP